MKKTLVEIISAVSELNEEAFVFAKRIDCAFRDESEAVVLELTEEELSLPTAEVARIKCPGYEYFSEVFLIKELLEDQPLQPNKAELKQLVDRVIHYAEFDS